MVKIALALTTTTDDLKANLAVADAIVEEAAGNGADLLAFPPPPPAARYRGPCLFVRGERSDYVLDEHREAITELFPAARIATVADAGHWVHAERPRAFLETVEPFLDGLADA